MKKRIAIVLPSFDVGGTEKMVTDLVSNIDMSCFQLLVISLAGSRANHLEDIVKRSGAELYFAGKGEANIINVICNVNRELERFKPDLIHTNMYAFAFATPYAITHDLIMLHTIHNKPSKEFKLKYKKLMSLLYKRHKVVPIAISPIIKKELTALYPMLNTTVELVYNPVDTARYAVKRRKKEGKDVVFVHIGRMMKQKNQKLLLEAFSMARNMVPEIRLIMVGEGPLLEANKKRAEEEDLKGSVSFTGIVSDVRSYLAEGDVFVLSSDYEGLPLAALEAMAAGLPILSTNVGGMADIVTDNGYLVPAGDIEALAEKMICLATDSLTREQMGVRSSAYAKRYDISEFIKKYQELYIKYAI